MRRLLGWFIHVPKRFRPACPSFHTLMSKNTSVLLCKSSSQGGRICNGTLSKKTLLSDPQLFEAQFEELVLELTEKDIADPALADAVSRLREVCLLVYLAVLCLKALISCFKYVCILLGADVQCSRREEKPRTVCDWFAERTSPTLRAHTGHGAASPVGGMVHRISKICNIFQGLMLWKKCFYGVYIYKLILTESTNSQNEERKLILHLHCSTQLQAV